MEKLEKDKYVERNIIKEKKQREKYEHHPVYDILTVCVYYREKERRLAEERLRKINEE